MNILIIGAGAVGIGLATSMLSQNIQISLYARGETAKAIKENGIRRTGLFDHYSFNPSEFNVYENYSEMPENTFDYVFVSTKTTANSEVSQKLDENRSILKDKFKIIIFQNGFGNDEEYLKYFTTKEVFCARWIIGFARHERHISEITSYTDPILLGSLQNEDASELQIIADMLTSSGINSGITDEIDKYLWAKMIYNCALNPLGAILDVTYGKLTENIYTKELMDSIIDEIFNVIDASGYKTLWETSDEYKDLFYSKLIPDTYNHYSSTHADIKGKIKTEIDSLNGKVIYLGEKNNIDVSTNKIIYNLIKAIESEF